MARAGTGSVRPTTVAESRAAELSAAVERVDELLAAHPLPATQGEAQLRACARSRAEAALGLCPEGSAGPAPGGCADAPGHHIHTALLFYAADMLAAHAIELAADPERTAGLVERLIASADLSRHALAREMLRGCPLLAFPPAVAIEVQLGLLKALAPLGHVSLWMAGGKGAPQAVCQLGEPGGESGGEGSGESRARELAQRTLRSEGPARGQALCALPVKRWNECAAALVGEVMPAEGERCMAALEEAVPLLGTVLERERLLSRNVSAEHTLSQTHERRLTRLGLDIHDGPLQNLAMLGEDLQLLRRQLSDALGQELRDVVLGRLDDLQAQLLALDTDLRHISASLQSPFSACQSLREGLDRMVGEFAARSGIAPQLRIGGDLEGLTDSQQMALLSIVRETLSNVREHSEATEASVSLNGGPLSLELQVSDNGSGFDVEQALLRAARDGRFGLIGLHERARLLGGSSQIDSRPGHPTTISVTLPRWKAVAPEES